MSGDSTTAALLGEYVALDKPAQALLVTDARSANSFAGEPVSGDQ